jgi:hypothetical protein
MMEPETAVATVVVKLAAAALGAAVLAVAVLAAAETTVGTHTRSALARSCMGTWASAWSNIRRRESCAPEDRQSTEPIKSARRHAVRDLGFDLSG